MVAESGPEALSARRVAADAGVSTTAVYTRFGGMPALFRDVRARGFQRLRYFLENLDRTEDPVADVAGMGWAYCTFAVTNPHLYRSIFMTAGSADEAEDVGPEVFALLLEAVSRCYATGRFTCDEPGSAAVQLWTIAHGIAAGALARVLNLQDTVPQLNALVSNLFVGLGDDRRLAEASVRAAAEHYAAVNSNYLAYPH